MTPSMHSRPAGEGEREAVARIEAMLPAIERIFPVHVTETPDYAELAFNECGAQAMTIEPDTWTALNTLGADLRSILSLLSPAAPDAGGGWMPIETAPKDGTWIDLLTASGGRVTDVRWVNEDPALELSLSGWKSRKHNQYQIFEEGQFTHWMPLPAPPALRPGGER